MYAVYLFSHLRRAGILLGRWAASRGVGATASSLCHSMHVYSSRCREYQFHDIDF